MVNLPSWILDSDSHSPAYLSLFISSDASIYSTMAFPPLRNSEILFVRYYQFYLTLSFHCLSNKLKMGCPVSSWGL